MAPALQMVRLFHTLKAAVLIAALVPLPAAAQACRIAVLGDSLTAGLGLEIEEAFPAELEEALRERGYGCAVVDAGVSGDTSAGGRSRLDWTLGGERPTHMIIELGGNDGLRALPVEQMEANLDAILTRLGEEGIPALLTGMLPPPNLGRDYSQRFQAVFPRLAEQHDVPLYPFFLEGVAADPALNQPDGIHPNEAGVDEIVRRIVPVVTAWLDATGAGA